LFCFLGQFLRFIFLFIKKKICFSGISLLLQVREGTHPTIHMASFDKVTPASAPTLAPKPIATAAPPPLPSAFSRERFFSDGDGDGDGDGDDDEEDSNGEEEDEEEGVDSIELDKIRGDNWSSRQTYASASGKTHLVFFFNFNFGKNERHLTLSFRNQT
jgi:hypothetical protein